MAQRNCLATVCMCSWLCLHVPVGGHTLCGHACGGQTSRSGSSLTLHLTFKDKAVHGIGNSLTWSGCQGSKLQRAACLCIPQAGGCTHDSHDVRVWDLNSGLLASMTRALPVKPSPQSRTFPNILIGPTQSHDQDSSHQMAQSRRQKAAGVADPYPSHTSSPGPLSTLSPKVRAVSLSPTHPTSLLVMTVWHSDSVCPRLKDLPLKTTQL